MVEDLIYDVGLHKGEDSAFYLAKGYRVVGFEANPDLAAQCRARFAGEDRMTVIEGAITDTPEPTVRFYRHPNSLWGTTEVEWVKRNLVFAESEPMDVATVNFNEMLAKTGIPAYIKIDIEGADMLCLQALSEFEERPHYVSIESTKTDWEGLVAELSTLERLGYDRFAVVQQAAIPGMEIVTEALDGKPFRFRFEVDASGPFGPELDGWTSRAGAEEQYKRIFRAYRRWGDASLIRKTRVGRVLRGRAARYLRRPLPGWFDTHAAR